jgi:glutamate synthase domain-containing protein 1
MIFEIAKDIKVNRLQYEMLDEKRQRLRAKLEKTTSNLKDVIVGGSRASTFDITLNKLQEIENRITELDYEYQVRINELSRLENIFKEYHDTEQLIYIDYKIKKYSIVKILMKYGISKTTLYRIIKKIESELI